MKVETSTDMNTLFVNATNVAISEAMLPEEIRIQQKLLNWTRHFKT